MARNKEDAPRIVSKTKDHVSGMYELVVLYETKYHSDVRYKYICDDTAPLKKILSKPVLTFSDWQWIRKHGKLIQKDFDK